jgi:hypothetical protein
MDDATARLRILDEIAIETPCNIPWDEIGGKGLARSCQVCQKDVLDLIEWPTAEVARILTEGDSMPCVRICRGLDGKIVTADNPIGIGMRVWRKLRRRSAWAASIFAFLFLPGCSALNALFSAGSPVRGITWGSQKESSDGPPPPKAEERDVPAVRDAASPNRTLKME